MAKRSKKKVLAELEPEGDARAALDGGLLLAAAGPVLRGLEEDLLGRVRGEGGAGRGLRGRYAVEVEGGRTGEGFEGWVRHFVEQVAAAWVLSCVFVRTLEDRGLIEERRIAGAGAADSQRTFLQMAPSLGEREYLLTVFRELGRLPAARGVFDAEHNPVWLLAPSAEALKPLLEMFRTPSAEAPALRFGQASTRFLGDLYQDLNENVRKRFALLQTPDFVEAFILDRTLVPAIERFGLEETSLIDPTCGSGHFLLGAFERLFEERLRREPGLAPAEAARKALDAVFGADINPYAVAVARFRLTLAYLDKAGFSRLADAPELPLHVVVADSLLHNPHLAQQSFGHLESQSPAAWGGASYALEDEAAAREVLHRRYAAVVGNPPYITVKDAVLRERYREMYSSAFRSYSLAVPFCERFFQLGREGARVGMITANSFMKREFGKKLIEDYLPTVDLDVIVNTSGAYIPGHGTPTVLLFGSAQEPSSDEVLAVLAKRGEPTTPADPTQGEVWSSIAAHWSEVGFENDYVSVARVARTQLGKHPWSLGGGGAGELKEVLESRAETTLASIVAAIGRTTHTGEDSFFFMPAAAAKRLGVREDRTVPLIKGEQVRDWSLTEDEVALFPYDRTTAEPAPPEGREASLYWTCRTTLRGRQDFGQKIEARGLQWFEHSMFFPARYLQPLGITFAFVATHNHFVLDRGGKVFNRSAPIIKLPADATEEDHLALLAYLNSSTACFWMKQVFMNKGGSGIGRGIQDEGWEARFEFDGTKLAATPLPSGWKELAGLSRCILRHAEELEGVMPRAQIARWAEQSPSAGLPHDFGTLPRNLAQRLVALQEELDWQVYELFGLLDPEQQKEHQRLRRRVFPDWDSIDSAPDAPWPGELAAGHRAFEQRLDVRETQWFRRNGYEEPEGPSAYSEPVAALLRFRMDISEATPQLRLIEQPEHKRRWRMRDVAAEAQQAVNDWALAGLERHFEKPAPCKGGELCVAWLRTGGEQAEGAASYYFSDNALEWVRSALAENAVPYAAGYCFSSSGLERHALWQQTWSLQRREDAGEKVGTIPVPPKYKPQDYRSPTSWRLRGPLDVPKERFISYPGCESDEDGEPVYGWAGWNHLERALALVALYQDRKEREGWDKGRLTPMLAGLFELLPWLLQWHDEPDPSHGGERPAQELKLFVDGECRLHGLSHDDLRAWRPGDTKGGRRRKKGA